MPARSSTRTPTRPPVWALVPGAQFAGDRYRLLERCGGSTGVAFWRAHDTVLARDVALTVAEARESSAAGFLDRTGWLCRTGDGAQPRPGRTEAVPAVLDMFEADGCAVVVSQWKQSHALGLVRVGQPADAAEAVALLAGVVRDANRAGVCIGIDHPSRIRVDADGIAYLAFPGVPAQATPRDDVRGLGNVLSELLTGMHHTGTGRPLSPSAVRPDVSPALSGLIVDAVGSGDLGADRVVQVLDEVIAAAPAVPAAPEATADHPGAESEAEPGSGDARTPLATWGPYLAGAVLLIVLATVGWFVGVSLI
ncbi:hypothetical protein ACFWQG_00015 [Rhodococcus sp. NPDC058532]|uniref:hypothetical protein n=1 Tax=Rhodococcus sp. NPDC058532 TaxID=3346540 RepID=UPI00364EA794